MSRRSDAGFSLIEILVAIFILSIAIMGAIGAIYAAGKSASTTRKRLVAGDLARIALADLHYQVEANSSINGGKFDLAAFSSLKAADELGPAGYQKRQDYHLLGGIKDYNYGWMWRVHSFDAATSLYSVDIWVVRTPDEIWPYSGTKLVEALDSRSLLYMRSQLEVRKP